MEDDPASALTAGSDPDFHFLNDSTKWTDEKHSVYLNHLESSFVKELHHSIKSLHKPKEQNQKDESTIEMKPFDFSGVRDGNWQMVNFKGGNPTFLATTDSYGTTNNQEGSGQNFVNEENHNKIHVRSRIRRMRQK